MAAAAETGSEALSGRGGPSSTAGSRCEALRQAESPYRRWNDGTISRRQLNSQCRTAARLPWSFPDGLLYADSEAGRQGGARANEEGTGRNTDERRSPSPFTPVPPCSFVHDLGSMGSSIPTASTSGVSQAVSMAPANTRGLRRSRRRYLLELTESPGTGLSRFVRRPLRCSDAMLTRSAVPKAGIGCRTVTIFCRAIWSPSRRVGRPGSAVRSGDAAAESS